MKLRKSHIISAALLLGVGAVILSCMKVTSLILPKDAKADSEIDITATVQITINGDTEGSLIFAMLVPKSWNAAQNATVTYTTTGMNSAIAVPDVTDDPMVPVTAQDVEPNTGDDWATACMKQYGNGNNYGIVEWVCFKSTESYLIYPNNYSEVTTVFKIKIKTGPENIKFNFGVGASSTSKGFLDTGGYGFWAVRDASFGTLEVTGGTGSHDFTVPALVSIVPQTFSYDDIFSVNFLSATDGKETALLGEESVYLLGKVTLDNGQELTVSAPQASNLMKKKSDTEYYKYIYPKTFFNVPEGRKISSMYFWFSNKDGSKVENNSGDLFEQTESGTPLE